MLFAEHGLSAGEISSLFVIWSVTSIAVEVPSGMWADLFSRRLLLIAAPVVVGSGYALWTFAPSFPGFALGFVLWGVGGSLRSGTLQALVYEELSQVGAAGAYARIYGRSEALRPTAVMAATALAAPVVNAGGYLAIGAASVAVCLLQALVGLTFPEARRAVAVADDDDEGYLAVLRDGLAQARNLPAVRRTLVVLTFLSGCTALDEYLPLLAAGTGVSGAMVAVLILVVTLGETAGGWLAGRGVRLLAPGLVVSALCLAAGAAVRHPAGFVALAVAFGVFRWAIAAAEARLQDGIADRSRATVTSFSGMGADVLAVLVYLGFGVGSGWASLWALFVVAALPYLAMAVLVRRWAVKRSVGQCRTATGRGRA